MRIKLPAWIVSNNVRISSVLFSDEKLVYKRKRIQYRTTTLNSILKPYKIIFFTRKIMIKQLKAMHWII